MAGLVDGSWLGEVLNQVQHDGTVDSAFFGEEGVVGLVVVGGVAVLRPVRQAQGGKPQDGIFEFLAELVMSWCSFVYRCRGEKDTETSSA